jgi:hypothetical protein
MLCPPWRTLNASATGAGLPDAHRDRPSREAGSFDGQGTNPVSREGAARRAALEMSGVR